MKPFRLVAISLALASACFGARAQTDWPQRNVRFIVAFAPAGPADIIARILGQALQDKWKQTVIVENCGGGGGNVGASQMARAPADGYSVLVTTSAFAVNLTLYNNPGYTLQDFHVVSVAATTPNIVVRAPAFAPATLTEVIAAAKTQPLSFASAGVGTTTHLAGELIFQILAKADVRHVPFTGAAPAAAATLGNHVQLAMLTISSAGEYLKSGDLKGVAVTSARRQPGFPDIPTANESGIGKVEAATDIYFLMPAKTPPEIIEKFNADVNALIADGSIDKAFAAAGVSAVSLKQREADAYVAEEARKWGDVINQTGVKVE